MADEIEQTLRELERARFAAVVDGDWDTFAQLCDSNLRYIHSSGVVDTRDSYIEKLRGGFYDYHRIKIATDAVLVTSELAIVRGRMTAEVRAGDKELSLDNVVVSAWIQRGASWQLINHQSTAA